MHRTPLVRAGSFTPPVAFFTLLVALVLVLVAAAPARASVFINEIHYDNAGVDAGEAIEIAGPSGQDLQGWQLVLYNGATGAPYRILELSGIIPAEREGHGALAWRLPSNGIQNGPDGIALIDSKGAVVEFLSYEGELIATTGAAEGLVSLDIRVREGGETPAGMSLQRVGNGAIGVDFIWISEVESSFGLLNASQGFGEEWLDLRIAEIQGASHASSWRGTAAAIAGIVTAVDRDGFYLEDPIGDGDPATSEGVFAHTGAPPRVEVGDELVVHAVVQEFTPGGADLSITQLAGARIAEIVSVGTPPPPTSVGGGGRVPPTEIIDDDQLALFDPEEDGIDFWESLEGMRVVLHDAVAVGPTNRFDETFVLVDAGAGATGSSRRGAIAIGGDDFNPERIQVQIDSELTPGFAGVAQVGDGLGDVVGVMDYAFGNFELRATEPVLLAPVALLPEVSSLERAPGKLTVASYNVRNLDPGDGLRFGAIARHIVEALRAPDILALQEIQDDDGASDSGTVGADLTWGMLVDAIADAAGPRYEFIDTPPIDGQDGGQPGANIRVGFLVDAARVTLEAGSVRRILDSDLSDGDVFQNSRKPLSIAVTFGGRRIVLVASHLTSRLGSSPLYGALQPPVVAGRARRVAQAEQIRAFASDARAADPDVLLVVLGDLNAFPLEGSSLGLEGSPAETGPLEVLAAGEPPLLRALFSKLPRAERYSFIHEGNGQLLDHVLVSTELYAHSEFDIVHVNAEFASPASDHDPILARLDVTAAPEPSSAAAVAAALLVLTALRRIHRRPGAASR